MIMLDRFYLGGPTSVRGFSMYSMGPQSKGKSISLWGLMWLWTGSGLKKDGEGGREKEREVASGQTLVLDLG